MDGPTSLLFGLDEFRVVSVAEPVTDDADVRVVVETTDTVAGCPSCGVVSRRLKDRPTRRIKDLPVSGQRVELWWRARRWMCTEDLCERGSFTERCTQILPRSRLTTRLRQQLAESVARSNRAVSDVGTEYGVGWHTTHKALISAAARWLPEPTPTMVLGIDETRARSVRWLREETGWRRSDPWMTSFVDADPAGPGGLLGLVPGRSGACVQTWLDEQTQAFRDTIEVVVIDPSAPYASGIRRALPNAKIAVDHWHLVRLANEMVTDVRQRVAREQLGRRGRKADPAWAHRRLLLSAGDRLTQRQMDRLFDVLETDDPNNEIGAAWGCKERLRMLLAERDPDQVRRRLWDFYQACATADMDETTRLATTIETWWPHILVFLQLGVTNARTEGFNRIIKQVKRVGCGYRNMDNYQRRILIHIAVTRPRQTAA